MRILVIRWGTLETFPPAINLVNALVELGHDVTVMANELDGSRCVDAGIPRVDLGTYPKPKAGGWLKDRIGSRATLRSYLKSHISDFDIVWTTSDNSAIYANDLIPPEKHVLQQAELIEYVPLIGSLSLFKSKSYVEHARAVKRVVVPEINRAYIQKAWWDLPVTPAVLPNKPAIETLPDYDASEEPAYVPMLRALREKGKRVVLYQGCFTPDRDLESYCKAVEALGDEYVFCLMGQRNEYQDRLCDLYPCTSHIGAYPPPMHLYAGLYASVGILPYRSNPDRIAHLSPLNSLYCAPNKIWEYALVGLPMVANDLPGLRTAIEGNGLGLVAREGDVESIAEALEKTVESGEVFSKNSKEFYRGFDFANEVEQIISGR